jgi:hypothetical protein
MISIIALKNRLDKRGATHALLIYPSSSIYNKKIDFKQKGVYNVTSKTPFCLKSIFLSKRGGQRGMRGEFLAFPFLFFTNFQDGQKGCCSFLFHCGSLNIP